MDVIADQLFSFPLAVSEGGAIERDHAKQRGFNVLDGVQAELFPQVQTCLCRIGFIAWSAVRLDGIGQLKIKFAHRFFLVG